ncbi:MAG: glycosyl hydrolase [bacterium]|nr:glycosyl hydrolase [bacterium]
MHLSNYSTRNFSILKPVILFFFICLFTVSGISQPRKAEAAPQTDLLKVIKWRSIGPYRGGRVVAVAGHPTRKEVFYFGGTGSGVWKTGNAGETWKNVSDGFFKTGSVGAVAVSSSNPNVIYVGMGESCLRGNISHGDGVYKSIDGGKSWEHLGLEDTRHIARIRIHPNNSDILYVAALGHAFGPNDRRGVFRSMDGGKTWKKILFRGNKAGAVDLVMEPGNPRVLFASFWQVQRFPWGFSSGGKDSSIYKSTDAGNTWKDITRNTGLPEGIIGRVGLTVSPAKPERVWAIVEAKKSGVYCSDDSGTNWKRISSDANLLQRPWYYSHIKAHPTEADTFYVMNVQFWKTIDNGKTFTRIRTPHGDNHDLWIDPSDPMRMIEGNDGGATVTLNGGKSWSTVHNQPTSQFYHVTTDNRFPYRVYGAQQDNSTITVPSRTPGGSITSDHWYSVGGCESGYIAVHPENPDIVYAGCYGGTLTRYDHKLRRSWDISVWPENPMGWGAGDLKYRFQWTFPILFSPHDPGVLYATGNHVFRSTTQGNGWEAISPDLTRNDHSKLGSSGGPLTQDNTSVEYYGTVFSFAESSREKGLLWAGTDDGLIHVSRDNGKTWKNITPKNIPEWSLISIIEPSHFDPGTLYVAATRYKSDDYRPYLYVTRDYGKSWKKITNGIPANAFTRVIREDPNRKGALFAGTETGIYFSIDDGNNWQSLQLDLPVVPIHDMVIRNNDLVLGTHGRAFWILDDLTLLYQSLSAQKKSKETLDHFLFKPAKTFRFYAEHSWGRRSSGSAGKSLTPGVIVNYFLKTKPGKDEPVTLTFLDSDGKDIRTYQQKPARKGEPSVPAKAGLNRFVWNMSYPPATQVKGAVFWGPGTVSPMAVPGSYSVRFKVGKREMTQSFEIVKDPNLITTQEQYRQQFDFLMDIRDKLTVVHNAVNEIRGIREQIKWITNRTKKESYFKKLSESAQALEKKLEPLEDALIQHKAKATQDLLNHPIKLNNKLAALGSWIVRGTVGAPTKQARDVFESLSQRVDAQLERLKTIIKEDVAVFNRLVVELSVPAVIPKHFNKDK